MSNKIKQQLIEIFDASVQQVAGFNACYQHVKHASFHNDGFQPDLILAVGKAASGMCAGALSALTRPCPALVVTKYQHTDPQLLAFDDVKIIESAHPVPDENSLLAGEALIQAAQSQDEDSHLLLLVSGGASALAESLPQETSLAQWQQLTDQMLSRGFNIGQINSVRKETSLIKDGKLLSHFKGKRVKVLAISDVEGDSISVIGSGIGDTARANCDTQTDLIATNAIAREAAASHAASLGYTVNTNTENMYRDVYEVAAQIAEQLLSAQPGSYVFGGEPTVVLPENPGSGGRNQSLALALAIAIKGREDIHILVAGTDGSDGPTDAAGGIVNGDTVDEIATAQQYLDVADAGSYLRQQNAIFITGPTNTNVMDLVIAVIT